MATNRGKKFEEVIRNAFNKTNNTSVVRLPDPVQGYLGYRNISDFIVYHYPYQYFIECKSVHGNRLPLSNITKNQLEGMIEQSKIRGVIAGIICWWIDKDVTAFIPIKELVMCRDNDYKSIRYNHDPFMVDGFTKIKGKKKRIFFDYDMQDFFALTTFNMSSRIIIDSML